MRIELRPSVMVYFAIMAAAFAVRLGWPRGVWAAVIITLSVFLHELAHATVARSHGVKVKAVGMSLKGGYTVRERSNRFRAEALTTMAGPLMNLLLFLVFVLMSGKMNTWIAISNLVLAISNLVPIGPTDGLRLYKLFSAR